MEENKKRQVWVFGHKNPDSDAICAAITYANLKNHTDPKHHYVPKRCGAISNETKYILERFDVTPPELVTNVGTQIKDCDYRTTEGVESGISLRAAWRLMKKLNVVTLPVVSGERNHLDGLIVLGDLAYSYMNVLDSDELSRAKTPYTNIIDTIEADLITGDISGNFENGKVVVGAGNEEAMRTYIDEGDLVIMGNITERVLLALEEKPKVVIVTSDDHVDPSVVEAADKIGCVIMTTGYDSFTAARLINQSIPISFFMTKDNLIAFNQDDYIDDITETLAQSRHRSFPVVDNYGNYVGMFSRRHLMEMNRKQIILVDHNEFSQAVDGIEAAEVREIIDHHRIGGHQTNLPVYFRNQPLGCTNTIIYQIYREKNVEISPQMAGVMLSAILSDTLMFRSPTCTPIDVEVGKTLAKIAGVGYEELAASMFEAGSNFEGKKPTEILFTDFKIFPHRDIRFGVSQISAVSAKQLTKLKGELLKQMEGARIEKGCDLIYAMLTNIIDQSSEIIYAGKLESGHDAREILGLAFGEDKLTEADSGMLPGVVSRKKQMVPSLLSALQQV